MALDRLGAGVCDRFVGSRGTTGRRRALEEGILLGCTVRFGTELLPYAPWLSVCSSLTVHTLRDPTRGGMQLPGHQPPKYRLTDGLTVSISLRRVSKEGQEVGPQSSGGSWSDLCLT